MWVKLAKRTPLTIQRLGAKLLEEGLPRGDSSCRGQEKRRGAAGPRRASRAEALPPFLGLGAGHYSSSGF